VPVVALLVGIDRWAGAGGGRKRTLAGWVKPAARILALWGLAMTLVVFVLWPALWVEPLRTMSSVLLRGLAHALPKAGTPGATDSSLFPQGEFGAKYWTFYLLTYLWRSTPVVLAGICLAAFAWAKKHPNLRSPAMRTVLLGLLLFTLVFAGTITLSKQKADRYLLPVYPPLMVIAGLGWAYLARLLWERRHAYTACAITLAALGIQAAFALNSSPYYFSYYNPLMGGGRAALEVIPVGWGEGLDQAASYLNQKPNASRLKVSTYHASGCFSYYFDGRVRDIPPLSELPEERWQRFIESDYAVIYITQWQRQAPPQVLAYVSALQPEHTIWINGLEYARIYKLH
jgi:hypothetical protein